MGVYKHNEVINMVKGLAITGLVISILGSVFSGILPYRSKPGVKRVGPNEKWIKRGWILIFIGFAFQLASVIASNP